MPPIPDIVRVSKLETYFHTNPDYIEHVRYVSDRSTNRRNIRREQKWQRDKELGHGSYGKVWLESCFEGDDKGELRAVKRVMKLGSGDYNRELEAIALFSHDKYEQNFVKSFGWFDHGDSIFIAMEYLPKGDLHKYLGKAIPEKECQNIVWQILEGLQSLHEHGFAHRDLKPANILTVNEGPDWWVKIADFGISKRAADGLTALRTMTGTPAFAAPEVLGYYIPGCDQNDSYTQSVDIWSLGVITFLILTGEMVFQDPRRLGQYVAGVLKFPLEKLHAESVSSLGCDFVKTSMALNPDDRPSADEVLKSDWIVEITNIANTKREVDICRSPPAPSDISTTPRYEASATWSTFGGNASSVPNVPGFKPPPNIPNDHDMSMQLESANDKANILARFQSGSKSIIAIDFSDDGHEMTCATQDLKIETWDRKTRVSVKVFSLPNHQRAQFPTSPLLSLQSTDGSLLFVTKRGEIWRTFGKGVYEALNIPNDFSVS